MWSTAPMSLPDLARIETLSIGDLRSLVASVLAEVGRLREANATLRAENAGLKEEVGRLKGLPPRPKLKPSGMERASNPAASSPPGERPGRRRGRRGAKHDRLTVTEEQVLVALAPAGARFKGYEDVIVQDLLLVPRVIRYRRERWVTADGRTITAPLPAGIEGGCGPALRRFVLAGHVQGQVTAERLTALLAGIGVVLSKRQVVRLLSRGLDGLITEDREVLRAGLATAPWITVDDTGARHAGRNGVTTQIGDGRFTAFRTGFSKSRANFLDCLRAGHTDYVVDAAALAYMRQHHLAGPVIERLAAHPQRRFPDRPAWDAHLEALGITALRVTPDPVTVATQGAMWGAIRRHGLLDGTVVVSDDAGQFRVGTHALCSYDPCVGQAFIPSPHPFVRPAATIITCRPAALRTGRPVPRRRGADDPPPAPGAHPAVVPADVRPRMLISGGGRASEPRCPIHGPSAGYPKGRDQAGYAAWRARHKRRSRIHSGARAAVRRRPLPRYGRRRITPRPPSARHPAVGRRCGGSATRTPGACGRRRRSRSAAPGP